MKILTVGNCPLCEKVIYKKTRPAIISKTIYGWSFNFKRKPYKLNEQGVEFWLLLTDGTRMRVAICKECLKGITREQESRIFADITYTKLRAIEKDKRKHLQYKLYDRVRTIEVWGSANTEQELVNYLKEHDAKEHSIKRSKES